MQKETETTIVINEDPVTEEGIVEILGVGKMVLMLLWQK